METDKISSSETTKTAKLTEQITKLIRSERRLYQIQGDLDEQLARINSLNKLSLIISKAPNVNNILAEGLNFLTNNYVMTFGVAFTFDTAITKFSAVAKISRGEKATLISIPIKINPTELIPANAIDIFFANNNNNKEKINLITNCFKIIFSSELVIENECKLSLIISKFPDYSLQTFLIGVFAPKSSLTFREETPEEKDLPLISLFCKHIESAIENTLSRARLVEFANNLELKILNRTHEIQHRLEFETVIAKIAKELSRLEFFQINEGIKNALATIGAFIRVDRSYVFLFSENNKFVSNTHEWCAPKVHAFISQLQNIPLDLLPQFYKSIISHDVLDIEDISLLSDDWNKEKDHWLSQNIHALLCLPLISKDKIIGFTGFDSLTKRIWEKDDIALLKAFSELIVSAIERKNSGEKLENLAKHDTLTGLANRYELETIADTNIAFATRHNQILAILSIDLDDFKNINDTFGHDLGDLLLKEVGIRLSKAIRQEDFVARMGGDEFIVILRGLREANEAGIVAQKILDLFKGPFDLRGHEVTSTTSIGIACYPIDGTNRVTLLKNADIAMYDAKNLGKNKYQFFTKELQEKRQKQLEMEKALQLAIGKNEFYLVYQPEFDINRKIIGMEVLLRWENPDLGLVPTLEFITLAEDRGLILPIDRWVFQKATEQYQKWKNAGLIRDFKLGINVSFRQFEHSNVSEELSLVIEKNSTQANNFELELTETAFIRNPEFVRSVVSDLTKKGFKVTIDDFGTGYSSLSYLKNLPIQRIKIGQNFTKSIGIEKNDEIIIEATIELAKKLNLEIIAEGVETEDQLQFLIAHGCTQFQGYYFSKPLKTDDMTALLQKQLNENS